MLWPLEKLLMQLKLGRDLTAQVTAALQWINTVVCEEDLILVDFPTYRRFFHFEFPLRYGDSPNVVAGDTSKATFIVRKPTRSVAPAKLDGCIEIFSSSLIQIFESNRRHHRIHPLRWRLDEKERKLALKIARDALKKFLETGQRLDRSELQNLPPRFYLRTDLDVTLWAQGHLRGSAVAENRHLAEGIAEAATLAARDLRFKPLSLDELAATRIEITLMLEPKIPLSDVERRNRMPYPERGYYLVYGTARGWYLPQVFNVRRFDSFDELLRSLASGKAGITPPAYEEATTYIFEVEDFIESINHDRSLRLWGPIVRLENEITLEFIEHRLRAAADWLCRIQESDGNIPPIIEPFVTGRQPQIAWSRLAFTAWALVAFGKTVAEERYVGAAEKSFEYLKAYLLPNAKFAIPNYELTLAYFGQLAMTLERTSDAVAVADQIHERLEALPFEPITYSQIVSFFKVLGKESEQFLTPSENTARILEENFEKNVKARRPMSLAVWAELVGTFHGIKDEFSRKVADWLKGYQLPSGAFPESTVGGVPYTRGTGKIFEVLTFQHKENSEVTRKALAWLTAMQYDTENTFFVPEEIRTKILGGFGHDYFNHEAWIDAAGHILLGGTRLLLEK